MLDHTDPTVPICHLTWVVLQCGAHQGLHESSIVLMEIIQTSSRVSRDGLSMLHFAVCRSVCPYKLHRHPFFVVMYVRVH